MNGRSNPKCPSELAAYHLAGVASLFDFGLSAIKDKCGYLYMPRSRPSTRLAALTLNVPQMRRRVLIVIGLPASICCQWRAENPYPIMSSCV